MKTTLNQIRSHSPCYSGWRNLLAHLGKFKADDEPLSILAILDSNGLDDALWCLRAVKGFDREIRLYAVRCGRRVQHLMTDQRSIDALDVAERFANGEATQDELDAAGAAAGAAARGVARGAAWAARDAAWAARDVARAARDVARDAAGAAAWDVARDAAGAAAWKAAGAAARAAGAAARGAAWAARDAQEEDLREMCERASNEVS